MKMCGDDQLNVLLQTGQPLSSEDSTKVLRTILHKQDETLARIENLETQTAATISGFPAGDPDSHRRYHEAVLEDVASRKRLTQAIQEKTISGLIWAFLIGCGTAVWHELVKRLNP